MMRMIDGGDQDDKILAVPTQDPRYQEVQDLEDVAPHLLKEIAQFFQDYKALEGKETEVQGWVGKEEAFKAIKHSIELYKKM